MGVFGNGGDTAAASNSSGFGGMSDSDILNGFGGMSVSENGQPALPQRQMTAGGGGKKTNEDLLSLF